MVQADSFSGSALYSEDFQEPWIESDRHGKKQDHSESLSLPRRLTVDTATALIAAISVAPAMTIIDK